MLVNTPDGIINTDHVLLIRTTKTNATNKEACIMTMSDGSEKEIKVGIQYFSRFCGKIVRVSEEFLLMKPVLPLGTRLPNWCAVTSESIIAFRHRGGNAAPVPITAEGEFQPKPGELYAIQEPSGRCIGPTGTFVRLQDFSDDCQQRARSPLCPADDDEVF